MTSIDTTGGAARGRRNALTILLAMAACLLGAAAPAAQAIELTSFDAGLSDYQAGGHPNSSVEFGFATEPVDGGFGQPSPICPSGCMRVKGGAAKDIVVDLPEGVYAAAQNAPKCSMSELFSSDGSSPSGACSVGSQVGIAYLDLIETGRLKVGVLGGNSYPVYLLKPDRGEVARFGFRATGVMVSMSVRLRADGDYRLQVHSRNIFDGYVLHGGRVHIWGVPNDPANNPERRAFGQSDLSAYGEPPSGPRLPFMVAPSECGVDGITTIRARSWQDLDGWAEASSTPRQVTGCEKLDFNPRVDVATSESGPDSPAGLDVKLSLPQHFDDPDGVEAPPLRDATVRLPEGMSVNPAAADGLRACSDAELGLGSGSEVRCPLGSKIGTVTAKTPVLDEIVEGSVYVRSQNSSDPESGEMFRLALVLENEERGILVKLPGSVRADSHTGQLEATFLDNPQLPVSEIEVSLKAGPRAPLALPAECGEHLVEAELSAWSGHRVTRYASLNVDCAGAPFEPGFDAGTVSPAGGTFSPLVAEIQRRDGQAFLSKIDLDLPKGLLAKLGGVQLCPEAVASDGTGGECPAGSRIGTATIGAGAGSPFYLQGGVFLTGPYRGGPYGISVQVPVKAGPFDLGTVKVRGAVHVDPNSAEVSVASDALPQIVSGVIARVRDVHVAADRPDFALNPTSCGHKRIDATLSAIDGQVRQASRPFQASDCRALDFQPRLALRLTGRKQTTTGRHPGVRAVVRQSGIGEAAIDRARVVLPRSLALDPDNAQALCEYADGIKADLENHCPRGSIVGRARAKTPLLDEDLVGDVYFVKNVRRDPRTGNEIRTLPMIVVALRGKIAINLRGTSSTARDGRLVNTFASVPDAPVSRFNLNIAGGANGILAVTRTRRARINLCAQPRSHIAKTAMRGHNGRRLAFRTRVKTPC